MPYYKKVGKRFVKLATFEEIEAHEPSEGVWVVYHKPGVKSRTLIAKLEDMDRLDLPKRAALEVRSSECCDIIREELKNGSYTPAILVRKIFNAMCRKEPRKVKVGLKTGFMEE